MEIGGYNADDVMDTGHVTWRRKINRTLGFLIILGELRDVKFNYFLHAYQNWKENLIML